MKRIIYWSPYYPFIGWPIVLLTCCFIENPKFCIDNFGVHYFRSMLCQVITICAAIILFTIKHK